jgi:hypothetical protein
VGETVAKSGRFFFVLFSLLFACGGEFMSDLMTGDRVEQGNIGSATSGTVDGTAGATLPGQGQGKEIQILQFHGDDNDPVMLTLAMYTTGIPTTGPMVGIVEFGSGNGDAVRCEFDLQTSGAQTTDDITVAGGDLASFPANVVAVKVRNDAGFIPPGGSAILGVRLPGPRVSASLAVGSRPSSEIGLVRTIWSVNGVPGLAAAASINILVPPFAKTVRVIRFDAANSIQVSFITPGGGTVDGPYNVAANAPAPTLSIPLGVQAITVKNTGGAPIVNLAALFGLAL